MVKNARKTVLFITPEAKSNGGNVFLLNLLRWLKEKTSLSFCTIYNTSGDLEAEFGRLSKTYQYSSAWRPRNFLERRLDGLLRRTAAKKRWLAYEIARRNIGLIYNNTVVNHEIVEALGHLNVPVLTHCHELESVIHRTGLAGFGAVKRRTSHFIAVSEAVRRNLTDNHRIPPDRISLVHGFVPVENWGRELIAEKRRKILEELGIPPNAFVVGASGTMYWRKAPDIFIQIAGKIRQSDPDLPIYFLWIGGARKGDFVFFELRHDLERLGLENRVRFLEHRPNPADYFAALDVFAMVSREDPFPLVCLEAAALGVPVVCFDEAGGAPEFVGADCGFVVPYLDVEAFAAAVVALFRDRRLRARLGDNAARKVRERHNLEKSGPLILDLIRRHENL
jgi:glycosyltransferase involved in cell wall biosynthesis